jgi:TRAP-type C4-dicarboxylate transport system permease small subunit
VATVLERTLERTSQIMHVLSGIALAVIVVLTCFDVVMRRFGMPFDFPFEVVCALAGVVIALALPQTTLMKTHVTVEYLETKLGPVRFRPVYRLTRCLAIAIFLLVCWNAVKLASHFFTVKQHSMLLEIPEFIFPLFLGLGSLIACLVLAIQIGQKPEEDHR